MKINNKYHISYIRQRRENDCWAATAAMIMKKHGLDDVEKIKLRAKKDGVKLKDDGSLPEESVQKFALSIKKRCRSLAGTGLTLTFLQQFIAHGPVMLLGAVKIHPEKGKSSIKHALAIYGLVGNASEKETFVFYCDPWTGRHTHVSFDFFVNFIVSKIDYFLF